MQGMPVQTALAGPGAGMGNVTQGSLTREKEKRPFSFLKPEHFSRLEDYVKEETPENIAIIMNYLGSQEATRVFASLTGDQQSEVATHIASSGQISPDVVKSLEQKVKNAIEYSFGGEEMVGTLLDYADKKTQTKVLGILKKRDEALASRLRKSVFSFEDIANLSSQAINIIVRRTNLAVFAQIAKTMPDEFKNKVLESLPQAARKRLEQEIELGRPISDSRIREEKMRIIGIVRRLQQEGLIDIGGKGDDRGVNS